MDYYSCEEKVMFIEWYFAGNSYNSIRDLFAGLYPDRQIPGPSTIRRIVERFKATGNVNKPCKCKKALPIRQGDSEFLVLTQIVEDKCVTLREIGNAVGISHATAHNIIKTQPQPFRSFKFKPQHELFEEDKLPRMVFCERMTEMCNNERDLLRRVLFSDECTFSTYGVHNRQNYRYWSAENLHLTKTVRSQYSKKVNVWVGILGHRIIGPYFIEGSLNGRKYLDLLQNHVIPHIEQLNLNVETIFQQDGCPAHNSQIVRDLLDATFPHRWIGRNGPIHWPARSPDMAPNDFFLWGYLKDRLYNNANVYADVQDLKRAIREQCATITPHMLSNVRREFYHRLGYCLAARGGLFEHLI